MYKPSLTVAKTEHIAVPVGEHKLSLDVAKHEKVVFHPIDARVNAVDQGGLFPANPIEGMGQGSDGATATTPADSDRSPQDLTPPSTPSLGLPASSANGASSDSGPTLYAYIGGEFPPQPTETAASRDDGGERGSTTPFKVAYLTPLFVLLGLFFVFSVGGWVWGRAWHSKEREIRRRSKHARRLARDQHKAELQRIQAGWAEQGWGSPSSRRTRGPEKDATDSELDSEDDYEVSGPFSALGRRLMGAGGRSVPPLSRPRAGRYEAGVQSNSWWRVRLARAFGPKGDENNRGAYTAANRPSLKHLPSRERLRRARTDTDVEGGLLMQEKNPETQEPLSRKSSVLRATLRGTWNRIKHCIPWNVGWGYSGRTPEFPERRELMAQASNPEWGAPLQHVQSGLLLPPQLGENGRPYLHGDGPEYDRRGGPLSARQSSQSIARPAAPPNSFANLVSASMSGALSAPEGFGQRISTAWKVVSGRGRGRAGDPSRGVHQRINTQDEVDTPLHEHPDGRRCSLDEPQFLPPQPLIRKDDTLNIITPDSPSVLVAVGSGTSGDLVRSPSKLRRPGTSYFPDVMLAESPPSSPIQTPTKWRSGVVSSVNRGVSRSPSITSPTRSTAPTRPSRAATTVTRTPGAGRGQTLVRGDSVNQSGGSPVKRQQARFQGGASERMARVQLEDESVFTIGTSSPVTPHGHERKATFKTPSVNGSPRQQGSPRPRRKATPGRFVNTGDDTSDEDEGPKIQARRFKNLPSPTVAKTPTQETPKDEECVPTAPPPSRSGSMAEIQSNAVKQQQQAKILKSSSTHLKEPSSNGSTSSSEETDSSSRTSSTAVSSTPTDNGTVIDYGSDDNEKVTSYGKSRNVTPGKLLSDKAELLNLATMPTPTQTNLLVAFAQMEESSIDLTLAQISAMATAQSNIDRRAERDESASQPQTPVQNRAQSKRTLVQDAVSSPQESPASPLSRKKTWQERNGRWKLLDGTDGDADAPEEEELTSGRPLKDFVSPSVGHSLVHFGGSASLKNRAAGIPASNSGPLSPPSLPPPPARSESSHPFSLWPASPGPNGRAMSPLPHALTPPARVCQQDLFFSPPSLAKAYSSPGSDGRNVASPLSAARIAPSSSDGAGLQSSGSTVLKKQRSSKIKPSNSARSSPAQSSPKKFAPSSPSPSPSPLTPTRSPPPQRRAAMRPPKKYTAPLGGEVETRHVRSNTAPADFGEEVEEDLQAGLELSRAKSVVGPSRSPRRVRTPAEKERERQEAMDRVHSIVNRGYKERVAIRSPERGGNGPFTFNTP